MVAEPGSAVNLRRLSEEFLFQLSVAARAVRKIWYIVSCTSLYLAVSAPVSRCCFVEYRVLDSGGECMSLTRNAWFRQWIHVETKKQRNKQTDKQTDRQTNKQTIIQSGEAPF